MNEQEQSVMAQELAQMVTARTICLRWDISEDTLARLIKSDPKFPRPVTLTFGPRNGPRRFVLTEIQAYLAARKKA